MALNVDRIYVINLDRCKERMKCMERRLKDIPYTRFSAISPTTLMSGFDKLGAQGCSQSHYKIWEECYHSNIQRVLIFEDDVIFMNNWVSLLNTQLSNLPKDAAMLHLNVDPAFYLQDVSSKGTLIQLGKSKSPSHSTGAYILTRRGIEFLYLTFKDRLGVADYMTIVLQQQLPCYTFYPYLCFQAEFDSSVVDVPGFITKPKIHEYIKNHYMLYDPIDMKEYNEKYMNMYGSYLFRDMQERKEIKIEADTVIDY